MNSNSNINFEGILFSENEKNAFAYLSPNRIFKYNDSEYEMLIKESINIILKNKKKLKEKKFSRSEFNAGLNSKLNTAIINQMKMLRDNSEEKEQILLDKKNDVTKFFLELYDNYIKK